MPISIGIPFYNCEKFLPDAIRSVFAQTYQDWELLLVDDGSTDRSLEIARSVKDPRVRVLSDGKNRFLSTRLNQIAAEAKYDLVARMDSDDIMHPERLEIQHKCFDEKAVQLVSSGICIIDNENAVKSLRNCSGKYDITPSGFLSYRHRLIHPAIMARRQWFLDNPYDTAMPRCDDFELFLRCTLDGTLTNESVRVIDRPLLFYRDSGAYTLKKIIAGQKVFRYALQKHSKKLGLRNYFFFRLFWGARSFVYGASTLLGLQTKLQHLKNSSISDKNQLQEMEQSLQTVLNTPVPGMDEYLETRWDKQ